MRRLHARLKPTTWTILAFAVLISVGTGLLMLPAASGGRPLGFADALFTSTSASCVTGLVVVDTGTDLSRFGQWVVLCLIQAGGLGIMILSTVFLLLTGRRLSMSGRYVLLDTFTHSGETGLRELLLDIVRFTFLLEALGACLLFAAFLPGRTVGEAAYYSVFHSVSAFCNAGFSLFSTSFEQFRGNWIVNLVSALLIVAGGLGFLVLSELRRKKPLDRRAWSRLSLHSRLVLTTTAILLLGGTALILLMEWRNTLVSMPWPERILAAFYQSMTARTAGFNTLPTGSLTDETLFLLILLMFIGASPGSCGGGIKTTTFATLFVLGRSRYLGFRRAQVFARSIPNENVGRAAGVVMMSFVLVAAATLGLLMSEFEGIPHPQNAGRFLETLFEVVSAYCTVGLSTGMTGDLTPMGKFLLSGVMFVGRLGPLMVAVALMHDKAEDFYYAEESIMIG